MLTGNSNTRKEVEQQILGAILLSPNAMERAASVLREKMFDLSSHQAVFGAMLKLHASGRQIRRVAVASEVGEMLDGMASNAYLAALETAAMRSDLNILDDDMEIVADKWRHDEIARLLDRALKEIKKPSSDAFSVSEKVVHSLEDIISQGDPVEMITLRDSMKLSIHETEEAYSGKRNSGYDTGTEFMNKLTGPWIPGQYIIIGAATKVGKSALAMQTALAIAEQAPVLYFSFEMKAKLLASRQLASMTKIGTARQRRGDVSEKEYTALVDASQGLRGAENLYVVSQKMDIRQIFETARRFKKRHGRIGCVVVDHLGILGKPKDLRSTSDWELAAHASPVMKDIAEELDCVSVGLSQVLKENPAAGISRKSEEETIRAKIQACLTKPNYGQLKGSIAQDADHVLMPFRGEAMLSKIEPAEGSAAHLIWEDAVRDQQDKAEIMLALSRESRWPKTVEVKWDGVATTFRDLDTQSGFGDGF